MNRCTVSPSQEMRICLLGAWGMYGRTIQKLVKNYTGDEFSLGTIYTVLHRNGIRITDYRKGLGTEAKSVIRQTNNDMHSWKTQNKGKVKDKKTSVKNWFKRQGKKAETQTKTNGVKKAAG